MCDTALCGDIHKFFYQCLQHAGWSKVPGFDRWGVPIVIPAVDKGDGRRSQLRHRRVVQASDTDAVELPAPRRVAQFERPHAAVPAKEVTLILRAELVLAAAGGTATR